MKRKRGVASAFELVRRAVPLPSKTHAGRKDCDRKRLKGELRKKTVEDEDGGARPRYVADGLPFSFIKASSIG